MAAMSFSELCRALGRDPIYVGNLQRCMGLHQPPRDEGYEDAYLCFLEKIVAMRALHIPQELIDELFDTEQKCLRLLHVDSMTDSPTWYLDACASPDANATHGDRLLLTGYPLGFPLDGDAVQHMLDFSEGGPELFSGADMGEDVRRVLDKYEDHLAAVRRRIERETPVLENALCWARHMLRDRRDKPA